MWIGCVALLFIPDAASAASNPRLLAEQDGIDDAQEHRTLRLDRLDIAVTIEGSVAQTTLTADFAGVPDDELEGIFSLALPEGAVVHGYALDVEDAMIEGVPVARPKARAVYETKVREGIDPGLAEMASSNVFTTKVFPIREAQGRTIRVTFSAPVHRGLTLPLSTDDAIGIVAITLKAREVAAAPKFELPAGLEASWQRTREGFVAAVSASDVKLCDALVIGATLPRRSLVVSTHRSGQRFFQIRAIERARDATPPSRIRVYWDTSLSRRDDLLADEIELLERYVRSVPTAQVDLVTFASGGARHTPIDSPEKLRRTLEEIVYRGATSFAVLDELRLASADVCLLFSDGNATLERRDTFRPDCSLKAIASAPDADRGYLSQLTRESGGVIVRLGIETIDHALRRLAHEPPIIVGATTVDGKPLSFTILENDVHGWFVVGEAPRSGDVVLRFRTRYGRTIEERFRAPIVGRTRFDGAAALWAADRIAALNANDADFGEIERLSRRYSVAGPSFAYVVLEDPEDYVLASVAPPTSYPRQARAEYQRLKAEHDADRAAARIAHLQDLREAWRAQKEWWQTEFDPRAKPTHWRPRRTVRSAGGVDLEEVVVTGAYVSRDAPYAITVALEPWQAARPYIDAYESAAGEDLWRVIAQEERIHGRLPAFYLDTAEWLYLHDLVPEASEMLLSALDLPSSNDETISIVADRLLRYGYFDRAIWLYERAARLANHRPQPLLQLALALAKRAEVRSHGARADLQRAIALLNEVATNPWDGAYDGIGLVALMEANALIPRLRRLGGSRVALAPDLIALLDLDIRVVIAWNTAATDLDLWVDEPNGERAIYSNRDTAIGGRLSEDMMSGYGPEEYLLRRAAPGEYRIHVDVYAIDPINPNGATTVTARLIHDFGRPNEREASVDVELMPDETGEKLVGRIFVGGTE
jgi:hypothetical protein